MSFKFLWVFLRTIVTKMQKRFKSTLYGEIENKKKNGDFYGTITGKMHAYGERKRHRKKRIFCFSAFSIPKRWKKGIHTIYTFLLCTSVPPNSVLFMRFRVLIPKKLKKNIYNTRFSWYLFVSPYRILCIQFGVLYVGSSKHLK